MRNPKWHRDEIILALDLYFKIEPGQIHARNPDVIELSNMLNRLPIHSERPDQTKFRNPNGVGLKLSNFLAIDPNYSGKGMGSYSKLDRQVFEEFVNDHKGLFVIAKKIKDTAANEGLRNALYEIPDEDENFKVREGRVIYKLHKHFERNAKINKKKKERYFKKNGKLDCEICGFDYFEKYGSLGKGFMECHHRIPLYQIDSERETSLDDLALVCANCHRMLHREIDTLTVDELKRKLHRSAK